MFFFLRTNYFCWTFAIVHLKEKHFVIKEFSISPLNPYTQVPPKFDHYIRICDAIDLFYDFIVREYLATTYLITLWVLYPSCCRRCQMFNDFLFQESSLREHVCKLARKRSLPQLSVRYAVVYEQCPLKTSP